MNNRNDTEATAGPDAERLKDAIEGECDGLAITDAQARAIIAHSAAPGWVAVPVELTEAMHVAAVRTAVRCTGNDDFPPRVWRAMLDAALTNREARSPEPDMRAICEALGFDPTNHHNAAKCPYCRPSEARSGWQENSPNTWRFTDLARSPAPQGWRDVLKDMRLGLAAGSRSMSNTDFEVDYGGALLDTLEERLDALQARSPAPAPAEVEILRQEQAAAVMPLIGPLLDAWDGLPNDVKCDDELSGVRRSIGAISRGMDGTATPQAAPAPAEPTLAEIRLLYDTKPEDVCRGDNFTEFAMKVRWFWRTFSAPQAAAPAPAEPPGWKLVPVEPPRGMVWAGAMVPRGKQFFCDVPERGQEIVGTSTAADVYRAMLAATPPQAAAPAPDLHAAIMNLPYALGIESMEVQRRLDYKAGHRDARHAAAELVSRLASPPAPDRGIDQ
jgi:hypothetical protein